MTLTEDRAERVSILHEVARSNGSLLSIRDLLPLMPEHTSEDQLMDAINSLPSLSSRLALKEGFIVEKADSGSSSSVLTSEVVNRSRAAANLRFARDFLPLLASSHFKMVAISGSTSYLSVSRSSDLDFFCVAPAGRMWISLVRALIFARVFRLLHSDAPQLCLSCIMDEDYAVAAFSSDQGPLFARDALTTLVVDGAPCYQRLLGNASWISDIFPRAYRERLEPVAGQPQPIKQPPFAPRFLNLLLSFVGGAYIRFKSKKLNRSLEARGASDGVFKVMSASDHLIYESRRYSNLRRNYASMLSKSTPELR